MFKMAESALRNDAINCSTSIVVTEEPLLTVISFFYRYDTVYDNPAAICNLSNQFNYFFVDLCNATT